jgi:transposase InsO family protein
MLYPEKRTAHFEKKNKESNVRSFSSFSFSHPESFVLDSGSSSHMVSDKHMFITLDEDEKGLINTSCGGSTLAIEGKGSISLKFKDRNLTLHNVLYVPHLSVNLLSLRQLLLEQCKVNFSVNEFSVTKLEQPYLEGHYHDNLPVLKLEPVKQHAHLSTAELLHKSLGHVSYGRIRNKLGILIKTPEICKSCAVVKITKASFNHRTSTASRPFEELHLDLIGPIDPMSHKKHRYILTIVDSNTRFCAAIPLTTKSEVFVRLTRAIDVEAKRLGYYPSILHSDRGTEFTNSDLSKYCDEHIIRQRFSDAYTPQQNGLAERFNRTILESLRTIILDSGLRQNLWNEILSASVLTMNQVPTHKSKKSPFELFKHQVIPLNYFRPIGNPVAVISSNKRKTKLDPRGELGRLIGFNAELKSYRILWNDGIIVDSKSVEFLDYHPAESQISNHDELLVESPEKIELKEGINQDKRTDIKEEEDDELEGNDEENTHTDPEDDSDDSLDTQEVSDDLIPDSGAGRVLRDRTIQVKPIKYTYFTAEDPKTFKKAITSANGEGWRNAIDSELDNIERHEVWADCPTKPPKSLQCTWVFKTKPATNSSPEKLKARLCIRGFLQTYGEDFFETFAPTGKFPSLLALLILAIDLKLPIRQFDVKSAFLFAPLEEEIFIKTPEGSNRKTPYLKLVKSLYGLKQAPKNWFETLTGWFKEINYLPSLSDACLFIHEERNSFIFFHVDDLIVVGRTDEFEDLFLQRFPNSSAHDPDTLLGMNLQISDSSITLSQPALIKKGLEMLDMLECRPVKTPLTPAVQLKTATDQDHEDFMKLNVNYRSYTGMLNYLACRTRPDLAAAVSILSRFNQRPGLTHWREVLHCWKYLKGTQDLGLLLQPDPHMLIDRLNFFTDATWAEDHETRI